MLNFMNDPTGDAPWEEDTSAKNVVHVKDEQVCYFCCNKRNILEGTMLNQ